MRSYRDFGTRGHVEILDRRPCRDFGTVLEILGL